LAALALAVALAASGCASAPRDGAPATGAALASAAAPALKAGTDHGLLDGAPWRIDVPPDWNGELVVVMHGYEPAGSPREGPMTIGAAEQFLARGYAVAASLYSAQGWAVEEGIVDSERLRRYFAQAYAAPRRTWAVGHSMGGLVALGSLERHPEAWDGVLSACGVNTPGAEMISEGVMRPLLATMVLFPGALDVRPLGATSGPRIAMPDPAALEARFAADEARAAILADGTGIPRDGLADAIGLLALVLSDIQAAAGGHPVDNTATRYSGFGDDAAFNAAVPRYAGHPPAIAWIAARAPLRGEPAKPVVVLDNAVDPAVPARFGRRYGELARANGLGARVIERPPVGVGHCAFEPADVDAAFAALRQAAGAGR
jgi:pimeloyl-ACP methyl ester carboxylesterase